MRLDSLQGLLGIALVTVGCLVLAGWAMAVSVAGGLLFLDYSLDRWRSR